MSKQADICLIVEGAYPYVTGGVSSWIQSLITNMPDLTFVIQHIGAQPDATRKMRYTLPANVVGFSEVFLNDPHQLQKRRGKKLTPEQRENFQQLHEVIAAGKSEDLTSLIPILRQPGFAGLHATNLFNDRRSWEMLVDFYTQHAADESFTDFFWTFRYTYLPIFSIFEAPLPEAQVYHAVSTGFSGLLAGLAKLRTGRPFLLTEHGLYTREREIEIMQANWIEQLAPGLRVSRQRMSFFQDWWLNIYRFMEHVSYDLADTLISITGVNQRYQVQHGASPERLQLIPNGINMQQLQHLRTGETQDKERFKVGFVGRIVPIKDVKTFIRALKIASQHIPTLEAYLIGPTEEDQTYYEECLRLADMLELQQVVHFTGSADVRMYYKQLDLVVLTSLSEGQPLVILEGNGAGIPVIATNVGACGELVNGITPEDQALGTSGLVTPVASPAETASAIVYLWREEEERKRMGRAGQERVQRFYSQKQLYQAYDQLYKTCIALPTIVSDANHKAQAKQPFKWLRAAS